MRATRKEGASSDSGTGYKRPPKRFRPEFPVSCLPSDDGNCKTPDDDATAIRRTTQKTRKKQKI